MQGSSSTTSTRDVSLAVSTTDSMTWDRQISNQMCADECAETGAIVWPAVQAYTVCALGARLHAIVDDALRVGWKAALALPLPLSRAGGSNGKRHPGVRHGLVRSDLRASQVPDRRTRAVRLLRYRRRRGRMAVRGRHEQWSSALSSGGDRAPRHAAAHDRAASTRAQRTRHS